MASITISLTSTGGNASRTLTVPDADLAQLNTAYKAKLTADGKVAPTNADAFNALVADWVALAVSTVRAYSQASAVTAAINSVVPIAMT